MNTNFFLSIILITTLPALTIAQQTQSDFRQSIGLSVFTTYTKPLRILRSYIAEETDISPKTIPGFEGRLNYRFNFTDRISLEAGLLLGLQPYKYNLFVSDEFANIPWGDHDEFYTAYADIVYIGSFLGVEYAFPLGERSALAIGAGMNYTYFIGLGSSSFGVSVQDVYIFSMTTTPNPDQVLLLSPELRIRYNYRIGKRFLLSAFVNWIPSDKRIMGSRFSIFGTNTTLTGTVEKNSGHGGLGIGGYYLF
jgi:hypothetical protein